MAKTSLTETCLPKHVAGRAEWSKRENRKTRATKAFKSKDSVVSSREWMRSG